MDDQPNPYESPQTESRREEPTIAPPQMPPRDGWKFIVLGVVILCGLASFFPWLALVFAVLSSPVFIRYYILRQRTTSGATPAPDSAVAGFIGGGGLVLGILAASAGAFLGSCTVAAWSAVFVIDVTYGPHGYERDIQVALPTGFMVGAAAFVIAAIWLARRSWRD